MDPTRPITQAICALGMAGPGSATATAFTFLDVGGYNYQWRQYVPDHAKFPYADHGRHRILSEGSFRLLAGRASSIPGSSAISSGLRWDYLGETGIGNSRRETAPTVSRGSTPGAATLTSAASRNRQHYYRDVVWGDAKINLAVHAPLPDGRAERVSGWGWPDERQCWTWPGYEGKPLDVTVYSRCQSVRLELDGKIIATQPVNNKMVAKFEVPYQPGELRAIGLTNGKRVASASLRTAGEPKEIRLTADRSKIRADRNDLSYVTVEIVDRHGTVVPNAAIPVRFTVTGAGELAATGSPSPNDASSFHLPLRKTYEGRCLAILRPKGGPGKITLKAEADGIKPATLVVKIR